MDNVGRPSRTEIIGALNDCCRQGLDRRARIVITRSCLATFVEAGVPTLVAQIEIMAALRAHTFDSEDRERKRGEFELRDTRFISRSTITTSRLSTGPRTRRMRRSQGVC